MTKSNTKPKIVVDNQQFNSLDEVFDYLDSHKNGKIIQMWYRLSNYIDRICDFFSRHLPFYIKNHFWPVEYWALYFYASKYILPRLQYLRDHHCGHPCNLTQKQWIKILDQIIWSLDQVIKDEKNESDFPTNAQIKKDKKAVSKYLAKQQKGFVLLGEYWQNLWD